MMSLARTPRSIATRVSTGRQSIARRRSSIERRRVRIGFGPPPRRRPAIKSRATRRHGQAFSCERKGRRMKLGVHIGYWGLGLTSEQQLQIVLEAERLGYDSVWTAEA